MQTSSQPSDCGEEGTNRTEERQENDMLDLDSLVAIDDAVDLLVREQSIEAPQRGNACVDVNARV